MNRTRFWFCSIGIIFFALGCSSQKQTESSDLEKDILPNVTIVYSASLDGEVEPCGCRTDPSGGIGRRLNWQNKELKGETLKVDSGDLLYASAPAPPLLVKQWNVQADALIEAYNILGIEVFNPGETDFAAGLKQFEDLKSRAKFHFISSNIYKKDSGTLLLDSNVILIKGGKRVGIFGLFDETLPLPSQLLAKDHLEAARTMVKQLRSKTDVILVLSHLGVEKDEQLAKEVPGIDAIFGAHTQSYLVTPEHIGDTLIFQPSFRGQHIGTYAGGMNEMHTMLAEYDSTDQDPNVLDKLQATTKVKIAEANKQLESELAIEPMVVKSGGVRSFQTFPKCASCHALQYEFYKKTAHAGAYQTLVNAKQNKNLDCLKCHTLGLNEPSGYQYVDKLVYNYDEKTINPESFAKSLPKMSIKDLTKISRAYMNVQCETCHGAGGEHPFGDKVESHVKETLCMKCHTFDQAPGWYTKDGKPNHEIIAGKIKSISCPALDRRK